MVRLTITTLLLMCTFIVAAQENPTSTIRGSVVDAQSDFPMPGVTVILLNTDPVKRYNDRYRREFPN